MGRVSVAAVASLALVPLLAGTGCAGRRAPVASAPPPAGAATSVAPRPALAPTFRFDVGDEVGIEIWQEPDLKSKQRVLSDGTISPPLLKTVQVAGLTIDEVQERLNAAYAEFLKFPKVAVHVETVHGDRVFVLGEVKTPQAVSLNGPTTVLQAIAEAEGFEEEFADKRLVRVIHKGADGQALVTVVDADAIIAGRARDVPLQRGDVVFVPSTGLADWSRHANQALAPIASIVGIAGGVATVFLAAND